METKNDRRYEYLIQVVNFVAYVARHFRLFYLILALTLCVLFLEYVATSLMIPMAHSQNGGGGSVVAVWHQFAGKMGMLPVFRTWLWFFLLLMAARLIFGYVLLVLTTWLGIHPFSWLLHLPGGRRHI